MNVNSRTESIQNKKAVDFCVVFVGNPHQIIGKQPKNYMERNEQSSVSYWESP